LTNTSFGPLPWFCMAGLLLLGGHTARWLAP
jgi:hypothetical protein